MALTRRETLARGAALTAAFPLAGCATAPDRVAGWPLWRRDPARTGHNPDAEGPSAGRVRWAVRTDERAAAPVVADGTVFVGGDAVLAIDADDGTTRWRRDLYFDTATPPAVADGSVYATSKFAYYAIEAASGDDRWLASDGDWRFHAPTVADGTLYLAATSFGTADFAGRVVALDAERGEPLWGADVGKNVLPPFSPAIADGRLFVGRDRVYALDEGGDRRWTFETPGVTAYGDPAVADGTVYVPGTRPAEGTPKGVVLALSAADGRERWRVDLGLSPSPPAVADGTVYVTSDRVYALDAADGRERWRAGTNAYVTASPSVAGGRVYLGGVAGVLLALEAATGDVAWRLPTGGSLLRSPAVVGRTVYAAGGQGALAVGPSRPG